jgi:hypothetical protein
MSFFKAVSRRYMRSYRQIRTCRVEKLLLIFCSRTRQGRIWRMFVIASAGINRGLACEQKDNFRYFNEMSYASMQLL